MHIKELIKQKKIKKLKSNDQHIVNNNYKENNKQENNTENTVKKVNNVPCDHSPYVSIRPDTISHIKIKDKRACLKECSEHPCTFLCPSHVYGWTMEGVKVDYQRCIECGACNIFCPEGNIDWKYPRSGYGITRKY